MCARSPAPHVARGRKTHSFPSAITLILRCESKFHTIKFRILTHSACPYKNYVPKCSQFLHELFLFFFLVCNFSRGPHTKQKKNGPKTTAGYIVEPYNANRHQKSNIYIQCLVKGCQHIPHAGNFLWANMASYTNIWRNLKCHISNFKV